MEGWELQIDEMVAQRAVKRLVLPFCFDEIDSSMIEQILIETFKNLFTRGTPSDDTWFKGKEAKRDRIEVSNILPHQSASPYYGGF